MIFTSLQVLRNTYRFNYEPTNMLSKKGFAVHFLNYFYQTMLAKRLLDFMQPNITPQFLYLTLKAKKKFSVINTEIYTVDFFYFIGSNWCLLAFKILEFTELHPSVFRLKPYVKKSFGPRKVVSLVYRRHLV